jgi:phospholipid/cholesterol/gamma-HCH transport system substrate-binding protein
MSKANPAIIGAFVVSAIAILVGIVLVLGSGRLFRHTHTYVLFFKTDVEGLRIGAAVKFKGVRVGIVRQIVLALPNALEPASEVGEYGQLVIPVLIELDADRITSLGARKVDLDNAQTMPALIKVGLRAQLGLESLVTGVRYIALDIRPHTPVQMILPPGSDYQEIPTIPATLDTVQEQATRVLAKLQTVDVTAALTSLVDAARSIQQRVNSPEMEAALSGARPALRDIADAARSLKVLADGLHRETGPLVRDLHSASAKTDHAIDEANLVFGSIQTNLEPGSPLTYKLNNTLDDLSSAARSVRHLADYLEQNPSAVLRGRGDGTQFAR